MRRYRWEKYVDRELLKLKFCDLGLKLTDTKLSYRINKLYSELEKKGVHFQPHFWLSNDWFTPLGVSGIAIPFYVAHTRLSRLERNQIYEVEGGDSKWFMKLLRHECGHAIDNAYGLKRRRKRQQLFGKSTQEYSPYYSAKPYSKRFVRHLDSWYAQSHPDEDFAESFAVWLTPRSNWKKRYKGWGALKKLNYIDELMSEIGNKKPNLLDRSKVDTLSQLKITLGQYYKKKRDYLGLDYPDYHSRYLERLFTTDPNFSNGLYAAKFLSGIRKEARQIVSIWTGIYQYTIDQVIKEIIDEVREREMKLKSAPDETKQNFISLLTVETMNFINDKSHWLPR